MVIAVYLADRRKDHRPPPGFGFWFKVKFDLDLDGLRKGSIQDRNGRFVDGIERQRGGVLAQQRGAYSREQRKLLGRLKLVEEGNPEVPTINIPTDLGIQVIDDLGNERTDQCGFGTLERPVAVWCSPHGMHRGCHE
jgi:hypothetical protein